MYGMSAPPLTESLKDVSFPIAREALIRAHGQIPIDLAQPETPEGEFITLEAALTRVEQSEFRSISDLAVAIGEISRTGDETY